MRVFPFLALVFIATAVRADDPPARTFTAEQTAAGLEVFQNHIRLVLAHKCVKCHGGDHVEGEFDLRTRETMLRGGASGIAVVPGDAKASRLYKLVARQEEPYMPEEGESFSAAELAHLEKWIDLGAPFDKPLIQPDADTTPWTERRVSPDAVKHWAFHPLSQAPPPLVEQTNWARTPLDHFILKKLAEKKIVPNGIADRRVLLRRPAFDLVGIPPTAEEAKTFFSDKSPDAYERLLDRLLASPRHGERWGRHWLDVARFAESHGFEQDYDRPHAYHFRDFVIEALNQDMPFDQFVKWQLAGDELAPNEILALKATGFLGAGVFPTQITANEVERTRYDALDDMAGTTGTAMLGLTIGCARCHDHKFDPIPQADYYRFLATFTTTVRSNHEINLDPEGYRTAKEAHDKIAAPAIDALSTFERDELPKRLAEWEAAQAKEKPDPAAPKEIVAIAGKPADKRSSKERDALVGWFKKRDEDWKKLKQAVDQMAAAAPKPKLLTVMISSEGVTPIRHHTQGGDFFKETFFLKRGNSDQKEGVASQAFLQAVTKPDAPRERWYQPPPAGARTSHRRAALANWITDTEQGAGQLLARVIVNRLWHHHFGRGLVATPNDFGNQGTPPSHPELLDNLANELIRGGWQLKPLHRRIMSSAAYMQSAAHDDAKAKSDPENVLLWRRVPRRLEAETIRDAMLAASGSLDGAMYGPGSLDESHKRRSIYFTIKRSRLIGIMQIFDQPEPLVSVGGRPTTTVAPQALAIMNNPHIRAMAVAMAARIYSETRDGTEAAIDRAYETALARSPSDAERADAAAFLAAQESVYAATNKSSPERLALADFCQVLFGLNEFAYIE